jgi:hypothetical protein
MYLFFARRVLVPWPRPRTGHSCTWRDGSPPLGKLRNWLPALSGANIQNYKRIHFRLCFRYIYSKNNAKKPHLSNRLSHIFFRSYLRQYCCDRHGPGSTRLGSARRIRQYFVSFETSTRKRCTRTGQFAQFLVNVHALINIPKPKMPLQSDKGAKFLCFKYVGWNLLIFCIWKITSLAQIPSSPPRGAKNNKNWHKKAFKKITSPKWI